MISDDTRRIFSTEVQIVQDRISHEEVENILCQIPEWRLRKALSYRFDIDRYLCAGSFLLLEKMLRENFGLCHCPEFSYGEHGKPFLKEYPGIHFNISHCRKGIACAVSDRPVGIDIEEMQYDALLAQTVLNPEERSLVEMSDEPEVKFTEFWTRKESFLKLSGEGIRDDLKNILSYTGEASFLTECNRDVGYVISTFIGGDAIFSCGQRRRVSGPQGK